MKTKRFLMGVLSLITFSGCAGMLMAGVPFNADKYYPEFIGVKLMPLQPAAIIRNAGNVGIHIPYTQPYGQLIARIPEGTIITINNIVRTYNVENEITDTIMGKIDVPGYRGLVAIATCDGREHWTLDSCIDSTKYKIISE